MNTSTLNMKNGGYKQTKLCSPLIMQYSQPFKNYVVY
jgi:hypothetical protein